MNYVKDIFERTIGSYQTDTLYENLFPVLILSSTGLLSLLFIYLSTKSRIKTRRENIFLLISCILIAFMLFIAGMVFIDITVSPHDIVWNLQDENHSKIGEVRCLDLISKSRIVLVENKAQCIYYLTKWMINGTDMHTSVTLTFKNESKEPFVSNQLMIIFPAMKDVEYISFDIEGKDIKEPQVNRNASVGLYNTFLTQEEYEKTKEKFLTYVLALIGIIFFTVPQLVIHLREIITK